MRGIFLSGTGPAAVLISLTVTASLLGSTGASAEPRTLYKPKDIQNARENLERYPWARAIVENWKRQVAFSVQHDRAFFEGIVPEFTPTTRYGQQCPACYDKRTTWMNFAWDVTRPDEIRCPHCGTVYPNEQYPETGVMELPRMGQKITYYQTPEERAHLDLPPPEREKFALKGLLGLPQATSFSGLIRWFKAMWAVEQVPPLAKLYILTGDVAYAERAAWILNRVAEVFPNWAWGCYQSYFVDMPPSEAAPRVDRGGFPPGVVRHAYKFDPAHPEAGPFGLSAGFFGGGRLGHHGSDQHWLTNAVVSYDLIREARHPDGRPVVDEQMARRIVDDLLVSACQDWENWGAMHNMAMGWYGMSAVVGMLTEQPERVRRGLNGLNQMLGAFYHLDGHYTDSPSYAQYNFDNLKALPDALTGYSDPPGYQPKDGSRLENLNPYLEGKFGLTMQSVLRVIPPGKRLRLPPIDHTSYLEPLDLTYVEMLAARLGGQYASLLETVQGSPLAEKGNEYSLWYRPFDLKAPGGAVSLPMRTEWFPGWRVGVLRGGRKDDTALYLCATENNWSIRTGHRCMDILSLMYYACGEEFAFDYGYFSGSGVLSPEGRYDGQYWTRSTASHNLVLVDDKDQPMRAPSGAHLELFGMSPGLEVVQAAGFNAYEQCEEYRRTDALIRTPDGQTYVVDLFRVKGGRSHQYSFRSNGTIASMDPAAQPARLAPTGIEDEKLDWTTWVKNPRAITPRGPSTFTWKHGDSRFDLTMLNARESLDRILVVDAPGWRHQAPASEFQKPPVQQIMAERRATKPGEALATQYAAVMVPYQSAQSPVLSARLLANDTKSGAIAVEVKFADRTDYIISTKDQQRRRFGPVTVSGEFAFLSVDGRGRATQGYLLGGTLLECGSFRIALPEAKTALKVRSVSDRTLQLAEPLPQGVGAPGTYLLAPLKARAEGVPPAQTGFEIESRTADTITVRDYPPQPCEQVVLLNSRWVSAKP